MHTWMAKQKIAFRSPTQLVYEKNNKNKQINEINPTNVREKNNMTHLLKNKDE